MHISGHLYDVCIRNKLNSTFTSATSSFSTHKRADGMSTSCVRDIYIIKYIINKTEIRTLRADKFYPFFSYTLDRTLCISAKSSDQGYYESLKIIFHISLLNDDNIIKRCIYTTNESVYFKLPN